MGIKPPTKEAHGADQRRAFGMKLKEARLTRYPSQEAFAAALGVAAPYVSQIEGGRRIPSDGLCTAMAALLPDALDWASIRLEAHRLRSPEEIAALLDTPGMASEMAKDPAFQRLWLALEQSSLPSERRDGLIAGWLQEVRIVKQRVSGESGGGSARRTSAGRHPVRNLR